jgi:hypothetical protein
MKIAVKISVMLVLFLLCKQSVFAREDLRAELKKAIHLDGKRAGDQIYQLCINHIVLAATDSLAGQNTQLFVSMINASSLLNKKAIVFEIEATFAKRIMKLYQAKSYIRLALNEKTIPMNQMERLFILLAYTETDLENYLAAIESYSMAEVLFQKRGNTMMMIRNYISIADLYIKSGIYNEAINSLNKARLESVNNKGFTLPVIFYENMGTAYFNLKNLDSLKYYSNQISRLKYTDSSAAIPLKRLSYMQYLLEKNPKAINQIKTIIDDPLDGDKLTTSLHLAQAYVEFNQYKNAKIQILKMLSAGDSQKSFYLSSKLYELMAIVQEKEGDFKSSSEYYKKSQDQLLLHVQKQLKSENVLAAFKYYDIKSKYSIAEENLKTRKSYFILLTIVAFMIIATMFLLYRSVKIRKRLNELTFSRLNNELSDMNSHNVRKYLCNILGIVTVIKTSDDRQATYLEFEDALLESAENLDVSIKAIAAKLNDKRNIK